MSISKRKSRAKPSPVSTSSKAAATDKRGCETPSLRRRAGIHQILRRSSALSPVGARYLTTAGKTTRIARWATMDR